MNVIDNPLAPEVFATALVGSAFAEGHFHLAFARTNFDPTPANASAMLVNLRIVMPISAFKEMVNDLQRMLAQHEKSGLPAGAPEH